MIARGKWLLIVGWVMGCGDPQATGDGAPVLSEEKGTQEEALAADPYVPNDCDLSGDVGCLLNTTKTNRQIDVQYPASGICSLRIYQTKSYPLPSEIQALANAIELRMYDAYYGTWVKLTPKVNGTTIEVNLGTRMLYMARVVASTKNGQSLDAAIQKAMKPSKGSVSVMALPVRCTP